ncbi:MAG: hypothetical protein WB930_17145 [Syntrophobacteraceae bacterium]
MADGVGLPKLGAVPALVYELGVGWFAARLHAPRGGEKKILDLATAKG